MAIVFACASNALLQQASLFPLSRELQPQKNHRARNWVNCRLLNAAAQSKTTAFLVEQQDSEQANDEEEDGGDEDEAVENFTEVGVVIRKHGIRGELLIKSFTDFPEEHFEQPGTRWMSFYERGRQRLQRVELLKGRISVGKVPCWLISLKDVNNPEEAAYYIGATMVVKREGGPQLEEGEFNVRLPERILKAPTPSKRDLKDEARKEALRARRKLQERKSGLKKSLTKTKQEHLLTGLASGEAEDQTSLLNELLEIDFKALQASFQRAIEKSESRLGGFGSLPKRCQAGKDWIKDDSFERIHDADEDVQRWWRQGLKLLANKKGAVACTIDSAESVEGLENLRFQAERLSEAQRAVSLAFPDKTCEIPLLVCTSSESVESVTSMIQRHKFFGLKQSQIRVLPQEKLPCFEARPSEDEEHKILRASPWKLVTKLSGEGGVLKALNSQGTLIDLEKKGVRFLQVVDASNKSSRIGDPIFFGFAQAQKSEMSIQVVSRTQPGKPVIGFAKKPKEKEPNFELVYSKTQPELLHGAAPLGSCVVSLDFAKRLQDEGHEFEVEMELINEQAQGEEVEAFRLKYSLLDCLRKVQDQKVSLLEVKLDDSTNLE